jgi:hypothetical protein
VLIEARDDLVQRLRTPLGEARLVVGQRLDSRPDLLVGRAEQTECDA